MLVSIIIPVYSVEQYIERCARSLFSQTFDNIEYVFVDDCTPDHSISVLLNVLKEYPNRLDSVKIVRHDVNRGLPAARETGIKNSSGEYIIHCDSDDWIDNNYIEQLYSNIVNTNSDVAVCDIISTDGHSSIEKRVGAYSTDYTVFVKDIFRLKTTWSLVNKLVRRELYNDVMQYPTKYMGEDMALCMQLLSKHRKIVYVSNCNYYYLVNPQSASRQENYSSIDKLFRMFGENFNIVLKCYSDKQEFSNDIEFANFNIKYTFLKRAKNLSSIKDWRGVLPVTSIHLVLDNKVSIKQKIVALALFFIRL